MNPATRYVIRLTAVERWAGPIHFQWVDAASKARSFEFMTTATAFAVFQLDLKPSEFTVDPIEGGR